MRPSASSVNATTRPTSSATARDEDPRELARVERALDADEPLSTDDGEDRRENREADTQDLEGPARGVGDAGNDLRDGDRDRDARQRAAEPRQQRSLVREPRAPRRVDRLRIGAHAAVP
jgi:hypothetical protein